MNPVRGEASIGIGDAVIMLRPSFQALVAAEEELGPLFALVERAAAGELKLAELVALFWHCASDVDGMSRESFAEGVAGGGLALATPALRTLIGQILQGR